MVFQGAFCLFFVCRFFEIIGTSLCLGEGRFGVKCEAAKSLFVKKKGSWGVHYALFDQSTSRSRKGGLSTTQKDLLGGPDLMKKGYPQGRDYT